MPMENGTPMSRARGASNPTATAMRVGVVAPAMSSTTPGAAGPNAASSTSRATTGHSRRRGRPASMRRSTSMLPAPLNTSTVNSTTVSA
jgi:hypothetical protein